MEHSETLENNLDEEQRERSEVPVTLRKVKRPENDLERAVKRRRNAENQFEVLKKVKPSEEEVTGRSRITVEVRYLGIATWALTNKIYDKPDSKTDLLIVPLPIRDWLPDDTPIELVKSEAATIRNICRCQRPIDVETANNIVAGFVKIIVSTDTDVLLDILSTMKIFAKIGNDCTQAMLDSGISQRVIGLLGHAHYEVQIKALETIHSILGACNYRIVLDHEVLAYFDALLSHSEEHVCKMALCFLSYILNEHAHQVEPMLQAGLLPKLLGILNNSEYQKQVLAAEVIANLAANCCKSHLHKLVSKEVIPSLCNLLSVKDSSVLRSVLAGLSNFLDIAEEYIQYVAEKIETCGGLDQIEKLKDHQNRTIGELAYNIVEDCLAEKEGICL